MSLSTRPGRRPAARPVSQSARERHPPPRLTPAGARGLLRVVIYLVALVPITWIYSTKERGLLIAPPIALIAAVASWFFFGEADASPRRRLIYAAVVGLAVLELTWAFGYWAVVPFVGGAGIWLSFYVLSGVAEHALAGTLNRRVTVEYVVVSLVGVIVVLASAPWRA